MRWEYAYLRWEGPGTHHRRVVEFSHRDPWRKLDQAGFFATIRALGDEGFEMLTELDDRGEPGCFYWFKRSWE